MGPMTASHGVVPDRAAQAARGGLAPIARALHGIGVSANAVTALGVVLSLAGAFLVGTERPLAALSVLIVGSLSDTLDGAIARASGGGTRLGAFLDSSADRVADAALFAAAAWLGAVRADVVLFWVAIAAMVTSFLVPYVRAKAESLGVAATVGPAPREARLVILLIGLTGWAVLGSALAFTAAIAVVAVLASITLVQRAAAVAHALRTSR